MRLKEIKPGMVIHCRTDKEIKAISDAGFTGYLSQDITRYMIPECYVIIRENNTADWTNDFETAADFGKITEFSDLILPELTAEEAVEWLGKHYNDFSFEEAFGYEYTMSNILSEMTPGEVVEKIAQWKSEHEKKEPEIETVDICRIIEVLPDGTKRCVHEETIKKPITLEVEETLKRYCMEHDGEFIAVHEVVSRVKAVE